MAAREQVLLVSGLPREALSPSSVYGRFCQAPILLLP
jgi:hypothetical protein